MSRKILYIVICVFIGCTVQKKEVLPDLENLTVIRDDASKNITLTKETTFGGDDVSMNWYERYGGLGWLAGLDVDDDGRVFIGEYSKMTIHVFNSDATYLTNLGRRGRGPGEFRSISDIRIIENQLFIYDPLQFRLHAFSLDSLKLKNDEKVYINRFSQEIEELELHHIHKSTKPTPDGSFLVGYMKHAKDSRINSPTYNLDQERPISYFLKNKEGKVLSDHSFGLYDNEVIVADVDGRQLSNTFALPFLGKPLLSISDKGYIYAAWSENILIKIYDQDGKYIRALYHPLEKKEVNREELLNISDSGSENTQKLLQHAELPEKWPALDNMIIDDENRLWLSTNIENEDFIREWWILKNTGDLIAKFFWPFNRSIKIVKNKKLYALETDTVTKEQKVVRYQIELFPSD